MKLSLRPSFGNFGFLIVLFLLFSGNVLSQNIIQQNFTGLIVPQVMAGGNSTRLPVMFRATVSGLSASTTYRYFITGATSADFGTSNSAGNPMMVNFTTGAYTYSTGASLSSTGNHGTFQTDATGSFTGWFGFVGTGNARFNAGTLLFPVISLGTGTTIQLRFALDQSIQVLQFATASGTNNGTGIRSTSLAIPGNIILLYDNTSGTGRPLSTVYSESEGITVASVVPFYSTSVDGVNGAWGTIIPNINPAGVRNITQRSVLTGNIVGCAISSTGVWPTGNINTVNPSGGATPLVINGSDAPLNSCNSISTDNISASTFCTGTNGISATVSYTASGTFDPANTFYVQLSDATGSFASPTVIGSIAAVGSGTVPVIIPVSVPSGSGYRVRVISDMPAVSGSNNGIDISIETVEATISSNGPVCSSQALELFSSGGVTYSWSGPNGFISSVQNPVIDPATQADSGLYTVTVTTASGCSREVSLNVIVEECLCIPPVAEGIISNVLCNGDANGSVDVTVTGGTSPFTFQWSNSTTDEDLVNAVAGNYTLIVEDALGCSDTVTFTITEPDVLTLSIDVTPPSCQGENNGTAQAVVTGGTGPYSFSAQGETFEITVSDKSPAHPYYSIGHPHAMFVDGDEARELKLMRGVTYTFNINTPASHPFVISSSEIGGSANTPAVITDGVVNGNISSGLMSFTPNANHPDTLYYQCNNHAYMGWIIHIVDGIDPDGLYTGLSAGNYNVTVTDANGCSASSTFTVTDPDGFSLSLEEAVNPSCSGSATGSIDISVSGSASVNTPGLLLSEYFVNPAGSDSPFEWIELIATRAIDFSSTPFTIIAANNGTASSKGWVNGGTSGSGAFSTYAFEISSGTVNTGDVVYVGGSSMAVSGTKIRLKNTTTDAGDGGIGGGSAQGVLGNGTGNADGIAVFNLPASSLDSSSVPVDAVFYGTAIGSAFVSSTTGYTLPVNDLYSGGHLLTTSYFAPDPGANHTSATGVFDLTTGQFTTARSWTNNASFTDGASTVTLNGLNTFSWSNGATTEDLVNVPAGVYTVTATNPSGCTSQLTVELTDPAGMIVNATINDATCYGTPTGSIDLDVAGGPIPYQYLWNDIDISEDRSDLLAGTYTVTITDANGCSTEYTATISQPAEISITTNVTHTSCTGAMDGAIDLSIQGGSSPYTVEWSTGDLTEDIINQPAGFYFFTATDASGCQVSGLEFINDPDPVIIDSFTPQSGGPGTAVTITGSGFTSVSVVEFNGTPASFTIISDAEISTTVPALATSGFITLTTNPGCSVSSTDPFTITNGSGVTLNLKFFLQGFYTGGGQMTPVLFNNGLSMDPADVDTVTINLHDAMNPSSIIETVQGIVKTDGTVSLNFSAMVLNNSYYIEVVHRNSISTWSKDPVLMTPVTSFDFTTAAP